MRILILLFPFLARFSDTCAPTRSATPIVCACATSEVALLYRIDGSEGGAEAIQPLGAVTQSDANNCPTTYSITCPAPADNPTAPVSYIFQDQLSGPIVGVDVINLNCTDGNWLYLDAQNGQSLVVSVSCQWAPP
ncbi:hypothetical protein B9Z55_012961 [Caenorhabditis nigoni]|uniref:C6 domain-containing protein n=1 Tax=Caenorhabditis nigoni TaxID=1611254 RepID=A0A2G5TZQ8_9PELO|nr:hypothetical protein B9Z55_012961 [Caenorhabditis nigoni]